MVPTENAMSEFKEERFGPKFLMADEFDAPTVQKYVPICFVGEFLLGIRFGRCRSHSLIVTKTK